MSSTSRTGARVYNIRYPKHHCHLSVRGPGVEVLRGSHCGAAWTELVLNLSGGGDGITDVGMGCLADAIHEAAHLLPRLTALRVDVARCPMLHVAGAGAYGGAARLWAAAATRGLNGLSMRFDRAFGGQARHYQRPRAEAPRLEVPPPRRHGCAQAANPTDRAYVFVVCMCWCARTTACVRVSP